MVQHKAQIVTSCPRTDDIKLIEDIDFKSMLLPKPILQGLKKSGYVKPSPIQSKALPLVRCGLDLIIQAKAGTGKTCVFTVAALEMLQPNSNQLQAVILAPTREIAQQIVDVISAIGQGIKGLKVFSFIGGYPVSEDMKNAVGCHIAVGTPGRMRHLLDENVFNARHIRLFVLDEADKLMEEAFAEDVDKIFNHLPSSKQVLAASATYTPELLNILNSYMRHGQYVTPHQPANTTLLLGVRQFVSVLSHHVDRLATLRLKERHLLYLLRSVSFNQCLVFSNLHTRPMSVCNILRGEGWSVEWIAGRQEQADRVIALSQLKEQRVRVLVTTDLTARGIDAENVNLIINLDVPMNHQTYLHRMGRSGRFGSHGMVITVVSGEKEMEAFQKLLGAIGGSTQSVNCVPEDLTNIDLWTTSDEELEQVFGILQPAEATSDAVNGEEDGSTDTEERCSPESSDDDVGSVRNVCNGENGLVKRTCQCNLYEVETSDIEVVSSPSLFTVGNKEEHWRDVLPVVISESRIPLNVPVILVDSKLIRVKVLDRDQDKTPIGKEETASQQFCIDLGTKEESKEFLSFDEIIKIIDNFSEPKVYLEDKKFEDSPVFSFLELEEILNKSIPDDKLPDDSNAEEMRSKYDEIQKVLLKYTRKRAELECVLQRFDSFDVVGWMAVDNESLLDSITQNTYNAYQFNLFKCTAGKDHIKVLSPPVSSSVDSNSCEDHLFALNLKSFNLSLPFSLATVAEQVMLQNSTRSLKRSEKSQERQKDKQKVDPNKVKVTQNKNHPKNQKEKKNDYPKLQNGRENKIGVGLQSSSAQKMLQPKYNSQNIPLPKNFLNGGSAEVSEEQSADRHQNVKSKHHSSSDYSLSNSKNTLWKRKDRSKLPNLRNSDTKDELRSKGRDKLKEKSKKISQKSNRKHSKTEKTNDNRLTIKEKPLRAGNTEQDRSVDFTMKPCSSSHRRPSVSSEGSGPYVEMSHNLAILKELRNFDDEYNSDASNEDDISSNISHTVQNERLSAELVDQRKYREKLNKKKQSCKKSLKKQDSSESETTNCSQEVYDHQCVHNPINSQFDTCGKRQSFGNDTHQNQTSRRPYRDLDQHSERAQRQPRTKTDLGPNPKSSRKLRSQHLFQEWYSTWYTQVRQRAHEIEYMEYMNMMSAP